MSRHYAGKGSTIHCPKCKSPMRPALREVTATAIAMNVQKRRRTCDCGYCISTTEIDDAELGELRRKAHLWTVHGGKA